MTAAVVPHRRLYFDGGWHDAAGGKTHEVSDPATGTPVGRTALAGPADIDRAVTAARGAAPGWRRLHADRRAVLLHRAADLVIARLDRIAELLTREQGKPIPDARKEIRFGVEVMRYYAEEGRRLGGQLRASSRSDVRSVVTSAPVGVVAAIVPWNYPVDLWCWKVAPALAAGCPVIAKPPPQTPLAIAELVTCLDEAGIPPGVLADLPGDAEVGQALTAHPGVDMITVTASTATGRAVMRTAAERIARVSLELGGQTPFVILPDADVEEAVAAAVRRSFSNMGQICIAVNRILVAESIADDVVAALAEVTAGLRLGHGVEPGVAYGPVLDESVVTRSQRHVDDALARGARLVTGGGPPAEPEYAAGTFFRPTVLDDVPTDALVMTEETYGPVAAVHRAADDAELLALANALPAGLAAYVYTGDLERGWAFADEVQAGAVGVNVNDTTELQAPFGGWKLSGLGRELGPEGLRAYREPKHIRLRVRPLDPRVPESD